LFLKKSPGNLTDTENKTQKKKKSPGSLTDTKNKIPKKKLKKIKKSGQFN
jgi:hypothetical protein